MSKYSPIIRLSDGIDFESLDKKNIALIEHFKKKLSGEIRYLFKGLVLPHSIEKTLKELRRTVTDEKLQGSLGDYSIEINTVKDNTRGKYGDVTEFTVNDSLYRSVPFNGDVYNHLFDQHEFFKSYVDGLVSEGIITLLLGQLLMLFHRIHDVPEAVVGDAFYGDKVESDAQEESLVIIEQINESGLFYTEKEKLFIAELFKLFEPKNKIFKGGEIINYGNDSINSRKNPEFFVSGKLFGLEVQSTSFNTMVNKKLIIPNITGGIEKEIAISDLPAAREYFKKNINTIQEMQEAGNYLMNNNFNPEAMQPFGIGYKIDDNPTTEEKYERFKGKLIELQENIDTVVKKFSL